MPRASPVQFLVRNAPPAAPASLGLTRASDAEQPTQQQQQQPEPSLGSFRLRHASVSGREFRLTHSLATPLAQHGRRRGRPRSNPFASLTSGLFSWISGGGGGGDIRRTFNKIDAEGKGFVTAEDLEAYARSNGLPTSYASNFATAVLGNGKGRSGGEIDFRAFAAFIKSRESALRIAFNHFDKDNDGRISIADLEASLRHVAVKCPTSRCIYRCNSRIAHQLFEKTQVMGESSIEFSRFRDFFLLLPQTEFMVDYWLASGRCPDLDSRVVYHDTQDATRASPWGHLVAGALAGAASRTATAPLETLRLAVMTGSLEAVDLVQGAALLMHRGGGWKALFRGNAVNVMRSAPSKALDFFAFDSFKKLLGDQGGYLQTFAAAGLAGASSWTLLYPLEVVRSRITCGNSPPAAGGNAFKVMHSIMKSEGPAALYRGLGWSVAAIIPEAAICYGLHDLLKQTYRKLYSTEPDVMTSLVFGVMSAFTGQLVAFPLETVSRRLQVSGMPMTSLIKDLAQQGGVKALYRGVGASILRLVPMACISFGTYECVRAALVRLGEVKVQMECRGLQQQCLPLSLAAGSGQVSVADGSACALQQQQQPREVQGSAAAAGDCRSCGDGVRQVAVAPGCSTCPSAGAGAVGGSRSGSSFVASGCQGGGATGVIVFCDAQAVAAGLCPQLPPPPPPLQQQPGKADAGVNGKPDAAAASEAAGARAAPAPACNGCTGTAQ